MNAMKFVFCGLDDVAAELNCRLCRVYFIKLSFCFIISDEMYAVCTLCANLSVYTWLVVILTLS